MADGCLVKRICVVCLLVIVCVSLAGCGVSAQKRRLGYITAHPELTEAQRDLLLRGKLWTGMTPAEARASLGKPTRVSRDMLGQRMTWIYSYKDQQAYNVPARFDRLLRLEFYEDRLGNWAVE